MKCYKFLSILLCLFTLNGFANILVPYENTELKVGEFLWVTVESEQNTQELKQLVNKRIHDVVYVQDHRVQSNIDQFYIIVLDAPKEPSKAGTYQFELKGFTYTPLKGPRKQEFTIFGKDFKIPEVEESKILRYMAYFIVCIILFLGSSFAIRTFYKKSRKKKEFKKKAMFYQEHVQDATSRFDLEELYKNRDEIQKHLEIEGTKFIEFCEMINKIQFKKEWNEDEKKAITDLHKKVEIIGIKNGI